MAWKSTGLDLPFRASEDMDDAYVVVVLGTSEDQVDLPSATTDTPLGVIQDEADEGQSVPVRVSGVTKVLANGAYSKGDHLGIAATTGRVDTISGLDSSWDWGTATKQYPIGLALEAAEASGELHPMLIRPMLFPWA